MDELCDLSALFANFRDLGGTRLTGGEVIRPGRLLRSATLVHCLPASLDMLTRALGAGISFDLRSDVEVAREGGAERLVERGWRWHRLPVEDADPGAPLDQRDRAALPRAVRVARGIARTLSEAGPGIVGCSLGKDRTGLVVALLLHWLDAEPEDIRRDFVLSNARLTGQRHLLPARWGSDGGAISRVLVEHCLEALRRADTIAPAAAMRAECLPLRQALAVPAPALALGSEDR